MFEVSWPFLIRNIEWILEHIVQVENDTLSDRGHCFNSKGGMEVFLGST